MDKTIDLAMQFRAYRIEATEGQIDNREFSLTFSSELPVVRYDWWEDERYYEILDHSPGAADFSRVDGGVAPLLWNHDPGDMRGRVLSAVIANERGAAVVKFSRSPAGEQLRQDVEDGIINAVSFGYEITEARRGEILNGTPVIRATKWRVLEVSLVSMPADPTVGVRRELPKVPVLVRGWPEPAKPITKGGSMPEEPKGPETSAPDEAALRKQVDKLRQDEIGRMRSIENLCKQHNMPSDLRDKLLEEGTSLEKAREIVLDKLQGRDTRPVAAPANPLGLSPQESRAYSILRAVQAAVENDWSAAGFERECHNEIAKRIGKTSNGVFVPIRDITFNPLQRATYNTQTPAEGGALVETVLDSGRFIDVLRNSLSVVQAGATYLTGLQGNLDIPRQSSTSVPYWITEGQEIPQSEATFGTIQLRPRTVGIRSAMTRQMMLQNTRDVELIARRDILSTLGVEIDRVALRGGAPGEPTGVIGRQGTLSFPLGTNGAALSWQHIVRLWSEIASNNAETAEITYLINAATAGRLMTTTKDAGSGIYILDERMRLTGYPVVVSNQLRRNLTKGTGTGLSEMVAGVFSNLLIGEWGVLELLPNPYGAGYASGAVELRAMFTLDVNVRYPESFCVVNDVVTA
ncbi:MAG: hypothetical protein DDT26_00096 [Dehalococcoidia bacterium]|nr:hypothetical protein [Chloroflexota bacterium]